MKTMHALKVIRRLNSTIVLKTEDGGMTWKGLEVGSRQTFPVCGNDNFCSRSLANLAKKPEDRLSIGHTTVPRGPITGRITSNKPNVKEIPRHPLSSNRFILHDTGCNWPDVPCDCKASSVRNEPVRDKVGFVGFCCDHNHPFDEGCKDQNDGCLCWEDCYDKLSSDMDN